MPTSQTCHADNSVCACCTQLIETKPLEGRKNESGHGGSIGIRSWVAHGGTSSIDPSQRLEAAAAQRESTLICVGGHALDSWLKMMANHVS